jgi:hypothetical protein
MGIAVMIGADRADQHTDGPLGRGQRGPRPARIAIGAIARAILRAMALSMKTILPFTAASGGLQSGQLAK